MEQSSKIMNRQAVLDVFRRTQRMSSTEVSETANQSRSTAHRAVEFLRRKNLLLVSGKGQSTDSGGKKPLLLGLNATYRHVLCFHIHTTGLTAGIADLRGRLITEHSVFFPQDSPLDFVLSSMKSAYENMANGLRLKEKDFAGVAVGCNGVADVDSGVLTGSPNFPSWGNGIPLRNLVAGFFESPPPVLIDNSNRFGAYAEFRVGLAQDIRNFITMDGHLNGVGAGVVIDGVLWRGRHRLSGEFGHIVVDPGSDRVCSCGARGCLEAIASMAVLEESARAGYPRHKKSLVFSRTPPDEVTYKKIYNSANADDSFAQQLVQKQAGWLAIGIHATAMLLDPDAVILQGSLAKGGDFLIHALNEQIARLGLPRLGNKVTILHSNLGRDRCLVGQAHYVADIFFRDPALYE